MGEATRLDGKAFAASVRERVATGVGTLVAEHGITPGLAVVLVGEDPASEVYVRNKGRQTQEAGMASFEHKLAAETSEAALLALVAELNADPAVHGILCQLPLPSHIDETRVINAIDPAKDVDGFQHLQRRADRHRSGRHGAVHAARLPDAAPRPPRLAVGAERGRARALEHRRQADGEPAAP